MVGARGADRGELRKVAAAGEFERFGIVGKMPDAAATHQPAEQRHQLRCGGCAVGGGARRCDLAAKRWPPGQFCVQIIRRVGDQRDGVVIAGLGAVAPADDAMPGEHHAAEARMRGDIIAQFQPEIEARALPGQPADRAAPDRLGRGFALTGSGERDDRVGMDMIDMREGQIGVERGIDRRRARIEREGAVRQIADHLVLMVEPAIEFFEAEQLVLIERRKPVELHRTDIAARTLDPQDGDGFAGQRIARFELGRGVAAAEIGDGEVRTKAVRAIEEQIFGRLPPRLFVRPAIRRNGEQQRGGVGSGRDVHKIGHEGNSLFRLCEDVYRNRWRSAISFDKVRSNSVATKQRERDEGSRNHSPR
jgi:hypothetical protein